jgi:hypothetical protein
VSNVFWALQGLLLVALVVTAVRVELDRRREERTSTRRVPVERRRTAPRAVQLRPLERDATPLRRLATIDAGLGNFTLRERARLLLLRSDVQDAKVGRGSLHDDLTPDESTRWVVAASTRVTPTTRAVRPSAPQPAPPPGPKRAWTGRQITTALAVLLLVVGAVGVVQSHVAMQASGADTSMVSRLVPGLLANPGKYAKAVNTSTSASASLDQVAYLRAKEGMDRWEAVVILGAALLLATRRTPLPSTPSPEGEPARQSSVANDFLPFLFVAALLWAALSFFELP